MDLPLGWSSWSPWGLVSGLFWVPSGVATVYAVKLLGLAVAVAIGNSLLALVSFTWGIFIFHERVHSRMGACGAVLLMIVGFCGMSYFSTQSTEEQHQIIEVPLLKAKDKQEGKQLDDLTESSSFEGEEEELDQSTARLNASPSKQRIRKRAPCSQGSSSLAITLDLESYEMTAILSCEENGTLPQTTEMSDTVHVTICSKDITLSKFTAGLIVATCGGTWGGSLLIPMKLCHANTSGPSYLMSFSVGAAVITMLCWMIRWIYNCLTPTELKPQEDISAEKGVTSSKTIIFNKVINGYQALPSFHLREMWLPGGLSGLVWSTGNFFAILSVHYLGAGVGFCVVQASMLVGGMWGIFYFHEIRGRVTIAKWFASALVTISGILLLAYEHVGDDGGVLH